MIFTACAQLHAIQWAIKKRVRKKCRVRKKIAECEQSQTKRMNESQKKIARMKLITKKQQHYCVTTVMTASNNLLPRTEIHSHTIFILMKIYDFFLLLNFAHCHLIESLQFIFSKIKYKMNANFALLTDLRANHIVFQIHLNHFRR